MTKQITVELPDGVVLYNRVADNGDLLIFNTLEAADELIERVKAAKEKAARPKGMPRDGQEYWSVTQDGWCERGHWGNDRATDIGCSAIGNVFLTEAECLREIERRKALQRVKVWIAENARPRAVPLKPIGHLSMLDGLSPSEALRCMDECESDWRILAGAE